MEIIFIPVEVGEVVMNMMVGGGYPFGLWATNVPKIRAFKDGSTGSLFEPLNDTSASNERIKHTRYSNTK